MPEIDPDAKRPIRFKDVCQECNKAFVYKGKGELCFWCLPENKRPVMKKIVPQTNLNKLKSKKKKSK